MSESDLEQLREVNRQLLDVVKNLVHETCWRLDEDTLVSRGRPALDRAIHFLAGVGRVEIRDVVGDWVFARWLTQEKECE